MRGPHRALVILLIGLAAAHLVFARAQPAPAPFGDETHYAKVADRDRREGEASLLPGHLRSALRPELGARVLSHLGPQGLAADELIRRVPRLNVVLVLLLVGATFAQGRLLGLSGWGSFAAAAALGLFPWFAFHVHSLWPEVLHATFAAAGLTALFAYVRRPRLWWLIAAGLALGYAQLTKSMLAPFSLVAIGAVAASGERRGRSLAAALVLAGALALVLVPQMRTNARNGFGFGLGANRWWNLELAVRTPAAMEDDDADGMKLWAAQKAITDGYMAASVSPLQREELARERTLAQVREDGWPRTLALQLGKFLSVLSGSPELPFYRRPAFEQAVGYRARWGADAPAWIGFASARARQLWYALLALGIAGIAMRCRRDRAWLLPAAYVLCGLAVVFAVPIKFRFVLPLVPVLCLGVGVCVDRFLLRAPS